MNALLHMLKLSRVSSSCQNYNVTSSELCQVTSSYIKVALKLHCVSCLVYEITT